MTTKHEPPRMLFTIVMLFCCLGCDEVRQELRACNRCVDAVADLNQQVYSCHDERNWCWDERKRCIAELAKSEMSDGK
jgi:hypothetical protein